MYLGGFLKEKSSRFAKIVAITISISGIIILLSIFFYLMYDWPMKHNIFFFNMPGAFIFKNFNLASFYIPLFLFIGAVILVIRPFNKYNLKILLLTIIPFLTLTLLLHILSSDKHIGPNISAFLNTTFGKGPGCILFTLILICEIFFIFLFAKNQFVNNIKQDPIQIDKANKTEFALIETNKNILNQKREFVLNLHRNYQNNEKKKTKAVKETKMDKTKSMVNNSEKDQSNKQLSIIKKNIVPVQSKKGNRNYNIPVDGILKDYEDARYWSIDEETRMSGQVLMDTLEEFHISAEVTGIRKGPVITMFEILPAPGVKLSKIVNLADNIALRLAASRVRIVAPIPGKHAIGIEVPNKKRAIVSFKELISLDIFHNNKYIIPIVIGKDIAGEAQIIDLVQTPHLLISGATGSGKSVCVNSIICSVLYNRPPSEVKLLLIDPKIVELKFYNDIPHLLTPVITNPKRAFQALQYCICEMERRYSLLDSLGVRDISSFNKKIRKNKIATSPLAYIIIVVDEFADLIANTGKEMEATIARLAAMSRAVGIHLVLTTQRPSVDVITGLIKANIPSRIAFMVASKFDSRIIIDMVGADKLLGRGDMLFVSAWDPFPKRIQGAYLSEEEVEAVVRYIKTIGEPEYIDDEIFIDEEEDGVIQIGSNDPLMEKALDIVIMKGSASASFLQRKLKIGYNRAARLVEEMEMRGIVGPQNGSKPRELIHIPDRK